MRYHQPNRLRFRNRARRALAALIVVQLGLSGCGMMKIKKDVAEMERVGLIEGRASAPGGTEGTRILLFTETEDGVEMLGTTMLNEYMDTWAFTVQGSARYVIVGFKDLDGDGIRDPGEPAGILGDQQPLSTLATERITTDDLVLSVGTVIPSKYSLDVRGIALTSDADLSFALGEIADLDDARFSTEVAREGMWAPLATLRNSGAGIYFLERYDPERIPVLFVHGIGGTPHEFKTLIQSLDRKRYQAWFFHYPSGFRLQQVARKLSEMTADLQSDLDLDRIYVVAHSMGGLVARAFIQLAQDDFATRDLVRLFVTFSTPLGGHAAAESGIKFMPVPVPAWIDIVPESTFLRNIRQPLPEMLPYYVLFGYHKGSGTGQSGDGVVKVWSQIPLWAQQEAVRIRGFDVNHTAILTDEESVAELGRILAEVSPAP